MLLEVNLEDLEHNNGEREAYWVLAIETARGPPDPSTTTGGNKTATAMSNHIDGRYFIHSHPII